MSSGFKHLAPRLAGLAGSPNISDLRLRVMEPQAGMLLILKEAAERIGFWSFQRSPETVQTDDGVVDGLKEDSLALRVESEGGQVGEGLNERTNALGESGEAPVEGLAAGGGSGFPGGAAEGKVQELDLLQIVQVAESVATVLAAILAPCVGPSIRFDCC